MFVAFIVHDVRLSAIRCLHFGGTGMKWQRLEIGSNVSSRRAGTVGSRIAIRD